MLFDPRDFSSITDDAFSNIFKEAQLEYDYVYEQIYNLSIQVEYTSRIGTDRKVE